MNAFWFLSLDDARCKIEAWRVEYNTIPPHSAIDHLPPAERAIIGCSMLRPMSEKPISLALSGPTKGPGTFMKAQVACPGA